MSALQDQLDEITANTRNLVQPERLDVGERAIADLFNSGIEDRILPSALSLPSSPSTTPPDAWSAAKTCSPSAPSSSSFSAGAGALIA